MAKTRKAPEAPTIQRSCGACHVVDGGPRNTVDLGDGRCVYFHLPGDPACGVANADPHPEIDEPAGHSQLRAALEAAGYAAPDDLTVVEVDASNPANHHPTED